MNDWKLTRNKIIILHKTDIRLCNNISLITKINPNIKIWVFKNLEKLMKFQLKVSAKNQGRHWQNIENGY